MDVISPIGDLKYAIGDIISNWVFSFVSPLICTGGIHMKCATPGTVGLAVKVKTLLNEGTVNAIPRGLSGFVLSAKLYYVGDIHITS